MSDNGKCLTGVFGVSTEMVDNIERVDSIGFYFGREPPVIEPVRSSNEEESDTFLYTTIALGVAALIFGGALIYFCCCLPSRNSIGA